MILGSWKCAKQPVGQCPSRRLPALLNGIEFRSVEREMQHPERLSIGFQKGGNLTPPVPGGAVNYQEHPAPSFLQLPQEPHKAALCLPLAERIVKNG